MQVDSEFQLCISSHSWYKDSHSLFDYESNKVSMLKFAFNPDAKCIYMFRKKRETVPESKDLQVISIQEQNLDKHNLSTYDFLTKVQVKYDPQMTVSFFKDIKMPVKKDKQKLMTDQSEESESLTQKKDEPFLIVRKYKNSHGEPMGIKLAPGQIIKLGRVQFFVSEICINSKVTKANKSSKEQVYTARRVMEYNSKKHLNSKNEQNIKKQENEERPQCKICLEQKEDEQNFMFKPCICKGTCGHVHLQCLTQWIHFKVKKEIVGGTLHYNFQKFVCQVCKHDLPMILNINGNEKQLLPIEKPLGNYIILQGACEKQKSVIMIQNVPAKGIKLGRGHQCQIRIVDISVSRNHGLIKFVDNDFRIYDNNAKFGTLVKQQKMSLNLCRGQQGVQIGRTVVLFQKKKFIDTALKKAVISKVKSYDKSI